MYNIIHMNILVFLTYLMNCQLTGPAMIVYQFSNAAHRRLYISLVEIRVVEQVILHSQAVGMQHFQMFI